MQKGGLLTYSPVASVFPIISVTFVLASYKDDLQLRDSWGLTPHSLTFMRVQSYNKKTGLPNDSPIFYLNLIFHQNSYLAVGV